MDKVAEIRKFQLLLYRAAAGDADFGKAIWAQKAVMVDAGVTSAEIDNLTHDRHHRAEVVTTATAAEFAAVEAFCRSHVAFARPPAPKPAGSSPDTYARATGRISRAGEAIAPTRHPPERKTELLIPFGTDEHGIVVAAAEAQKGHVYRCPRCRTVLVLHAGEQKIKHFQHKGDTNCTGETIAHETAKLLIAQVIREHVRSEEARIKLHCVCAECRREFFTRLPADAFTGAVVEKTIGEFRCDVVAQRHDEDVLAIEVRQTHAVDDFKSTKLAIPWVELKADAVLASPREWMPVQRRLKPVVCPTCKNAAAELEAVASRWGLVLPEGAETRDPSRSAYLAAVETCWKCHERIIVFWWGGVPFAVERPPEPIPKTVQFRRSAQYGGSYWANCCPNCKQIQGDNHVFLFEKSPFRGLPMRETPEMRRAREVGFRRTVNDFVSVMFRNFGPPDPNRKRRR